MGEETSGHNSDAGRQDESVVYTGPILCYNSKVHHSDLMSKQQDIDLALAAQAGDKQARLELLEKYERLCHKLARKFGFTANNHDHEDLSRRSHRFASCNGHLRCVTRRCIHDVGVLSRSWLNCWCWSL